MLGTIIITHLGRNNINRSKWAGIEDRDRNRHRAFGLNRIVLIFGLQHWKIFFFSSSPDVRRWR